MTLKSKRIWERTDHEMYKMWFMHESNGPYNRVCHLRIIFFYFCLVVFVVLYSHFLLLPSIFPQCLHCTAPCDSYLERCSIKKKLYLLYSLTLTLIISLIFIFPGYWLKTPCWLNPLSFQTWRDTQREHFPTTTVNTWRQEERKTSSSGWRTQKGTGECALCLRYLFNESYFCTNQIIYSQVFLLKFTVCLWYCIWTISGTLNQLKLISKSSSIKW